MAKKLSQQDRMYKQRQALYLRYGSEEPCKDPRPFALLSLKCVGQLMVESKITISTMMSKYFKKEPVANRLSIMPPRMNVDFKFSTKVTMVTILPEEVEYICSQENQVAWAHLSLAGRCIQFHRKFPDRWIKLWTLRQVMWDAGLRHKKVIVGNAPQRKTLRIGEFEDKILALQQQIEDIQSDKNNHLIFADESIFKARGFQMRAWSRQLENVSVEDRTGDQPCQAVCAAVCSCHKLLTYAIEDYSFDKEKFKCFLRDVCAATGKEKVFLFLDNCSVHKSSECVKEMEKLGITPVWNVPYHFMYNDAIEKFWGQMKAIFRPLLLQKMLKCPRSKDTPLKNALLETIHKVSQDSIPSYVERGLRFLKEDADAIKKERGLK